MALLHSKVPAMWTNRITKDWLIANDKTDRYTMNTADNDIFNVTYNERWP